MYGRFYFHFEPELLNLFWHVYFGLVGLSFFGSASLLTGVLIFPSHHLQGSQTTVRWESEPVSKQVSGPKYHPGGQRSKVKGQERAVKNDRMATPITAPWPPLCTRSTTDCEAKESVGDLRRQQRTRNYRLCFIWAHKQTGQEKVVVFLLDLNLKTWIRHVCRDSSSCWCWNVDGVSLKILQYLNKPTWILSLTFSIPSVTRGNPLLMTLLPAGWHSKRVKTCLWKRMISLQESGGLHNDQIWEKQRLWDAVDLLDVGSPSSHCH